MENKIKYKTKYKMKNKAKNITKQKIKNKPKKHDAEFSKKETAQTTPRKSIVDVFFTSRNRSWPYYNDQFNVHKGDIVYVDGQLEGEAGYVEKVSYSFKIKESDYKRVIARIDTDVKGDFYFAGEHLITFDADAIPYDKVRQWFITPDPEEEDYIRGFGESDSFPLNGPDRIDISPMIAERGYNYYKDNKVVYLSVEGTQGRAIVRGSRPYEIEFEYKDGKIYNMVCTCYCTGMCKHEYAVVLQLREILELAEKKYSDKFGNYVAAVCKETFVSYAINTKYTGKITL